MRERIFISHTSTDHPFCKKLVKALSDADFDVWYDRNNMGWGMLGPTIEAEIKSRPIFIVVLSPKALQSSWVEDECRWAYYHLRYSPNQAVRVILPVVAQEIAEDTIWTFLTSFKRIEAGAGRPFPQDESFDQTVKIAQAAAIGHISGQGAPPSPQDAAEFLAKRGEALPPGAGLSASDGSATELTRFPTTRASHPHIYMCFRKEETLQAYGLRDRLQQKYPNAAIILDRSREVAPAQLDTAILNELIGQSTICIILLTRAALQNLNTATDLFHSEVAFAIRQRKVQVIPVLLNGLTLTKEDLPDDVHQLANPKWHKRLVKLTDYNAASRDIIKHMHKLVFGVAESSLVGIFVAAVIIFLYTHVTAHPPQPQMQTIPSAAVQVAMQTSQSATATCPSGTSLLSGGYDIVDVSNPGGDYFPQESHPTLDGTGWFVAYFNDSNDQQNVTAVAYCLANAKLHTQVVTTKNIDSSGVAQVACPTNMVATSGGYSFSSTSTVATTSVPLSLLHPSNQQGWTVSAKGFDENSMQRTYVNCVAGSLTFIVSNPATFIVPHDTTPSIHITQVHLICTTGMLVGSGYTLAEQDGVQNTFMLQNAPQTQPSAWQLSITNFAGFDQRGRAWPLCATVHSS